MEEIGRWVVCTEDDTKSNENLPRPPRLASLEMHPKNDLKESRLRGWLPGQFPPSGPTPNLACFH